MNLKKHIWEGWTVQNFIDELEPSIEGAILVKDVTNKETLKKWCMDNQPYYKKYIKDVVDYLAKKYNIK